MTAEGLHIRPARVADAGALAELATQLGYPATREEIVRRLAGLAEHAHDHGALVAETPAGGIVGFVHVTVLRHLESDAFAEIVGLVVRDGARGAGVGARLVRAAREWAHDHGLVRLDVRSNVVREGAHRFYEREGFRLVKRQAVFTSVVRG